MARIPGDDVSTIPDNFLGLSSTESDYKNARYAILPVPYDGTVSYQTGTRHGPRAIITASQQTELFDEEYGREYEDCGIATLDPLEPSAAGPEQMMDTVFRAAKRAVRDGKIVIGLGGEHSITSALVRAVATRYKKNLSVLQIDAHADLRDSYQGSPYSHACVMRRVLEQKIPVVPVGIRSYSIEEHAFMKKNGFSPISARETFENPDWIEQAVESLSDRVYITIDIDGFDPSTAPGTGTPEPGGLDWYQVTDLLGATAMNRKIVGADVVEVRPIPGNTVTEFLAARLIYKLIAHIEENR